MGVDLIESAEVAELAAAATRESILHLGATRAYKELPGSHRFGLDRVFGLINRKPRDQLRIPPYLRPAVHPYTGHRGPWIEGYFERFRERTPPIAHGRTYIPIRWTDYYCRFGFRAHAEIQTFLDRNLRPDHRYFTIVQNDDGIYERLPSNVLVFGAGGVGDVPIPLLKGCRRYAFQPAKDHLVSFMGDLRRNARTDLRRTMFEKLVDTPGYHFGSGSMEEFEDVTRRSLFTLCPRGYGRTSFRLYEAMSLGSIPIYIWDDIEWLPYREEIDWSELIISVQEEDIERIPDYVDSHTDEMISAKQQKIRDLHDRYFSMPGTCHWITHHLTDDAARTHRRHP